MEAAFAGVEWNLCDPEFQWTSNAAFDLFTDASGSNFGASGKMRGLVVGLLTGHARRTWPIRSCSR